MPGQVAGDAAEAARPRTLLLIIAGLFILGFGLRVAGVLYLPNINRPDEIFQTIEPAFRMWSGGGVVTWEWREGIRSPIFPAFIAAIIAVSKAFGASTAGYLTAVTVVFSAFASTLVVVGCLIGRAIFGLLGAVVCGFLCAVSPDLVYFGPKLLTEVQAGNLLLIAAFVGVYVEQSGGKGANHPSNYAWTCLVCGFLLGLVVIIRFQLAVAVAVVGLTACGLHWRRWSLLALGFVLPVILSGLVDKLYWGSWFQSVWLNYKFNIVEKVSEEYGVQSHTYFFGRLKDLWGVSTIFIAIFTIVGARRAPMLAILAAAIIGSHSLIAHKEVSFIYAAFPPIVILTGLGTTEILLKWNSAVPTQRPWRVAVVLFLWSALWDVTMATSKYRTLWLQGAPTLEAARIMARNDDACGLAIDSDAMLWYFFVGDAYFGKPLPIYSFHTMTGAMRVLPAVNYAIGSSDIDRKLPGAQKLQCWPSSPNEICLARSQSGKACVPDHGFDLNSLRNLGRPAAAQGADHYQK